MSEFKSIQPDVVIHNGRTIKFIKFSPVTGTNQIEAKVKIVPPIPGAGNVVMGIGNHEFEAQKDAFEKAKKLINENVSAS